MNLGELDAEIDRLARERQALWSGRPTAEDAAQVTAIDRKLAALYEERRNLKARLRVGGRTREEIVRQARVESELERLMTR